MTKPNGLPDYAGIVAEAEKAVAAVKDPELKLAAFGKVLDTLLASTAEQAADDGNDDSPVENNKKATQKTGKDKPQRVSGTIRYITELVDDSFFKTQRTIGAVKTELGNRGHHIPLTNLSGPLQRLCQKKVLRREKKTEGKKTVFAYSKW